MSTSLRQLYNIQPILELTQNTDACETQNPHFKNLKKFFGNIKNPIGIEVEMEGVHANSMVRVGTSVYWNVTEDNSLRNHGKEFISRPIAGHGIDYAIAELAGIVQASPNRQWTVRTSIHVHVNVAHYTPKKLELLTAYYAICEDIFFEFVAAERRHNPYCYPLTNLPPLSLQSRERRTGTVVEPGTEMKYCAFNLAPVVRQLTVEFRHMEGNEDFVRIKRWLQIISKIVRHVYETPNELLIKNMRNLEDPAFLKGIFGAHTQLMNVNLEKMKENALWAEIFLNLGDD